MQDKKLFVPKNPIETLQEFQWQITMAPPEQALSLAADALAIVGDTKEVYGTKRLHIHAETGYVINRRLTIDEQMYQPHYRNVRLRGILGGVVYLEHEGGTLFQSFVVDMYDVEILSSDNDVVVESTAPVILPVLGVQTVMAAA